MAAKKKTASTKDKGGKRDDIKIQTYKRDLTCALTREEIEDCAQKMSYKLSERDIWEAQIKQQAARDKSKLKDMETEVRRLSNSIRDKSEMRIVRCERHFNYTTGRVKDVRLDNGEIIAERDMTDEERQKDFEFEAGDLDDDFGGDDAQDDEDEAAE